MKADSIHMSFNPKEIIKKTYIFYGNSLIRVVRIRANDTPCGPISMISSAYIQKNDVRISSKEEKGGINMRPGEAYAMDKVAETLKRCHSFVF